MWHSPHVNSSLFRSREREMKRLLEDYLSLTQGLPKMGKQRVFQQLIPMFQGDYPLIYHELLQLSRL